MNRGWGSRFLVGSPPLTKGCDRGFRRFPGRGEPRVLPGQASTRVAGVRPRLGSVDGQVERQLSGGVEAGVPACRTERCRLGIGRGSGWWEVGWSRRIGRNRPPQAPVEESGTPGIAGIEIVGASDSWKQGAEPVDRRPGFEQGSGGDVAAGLGPGGEPRLAGAGDEKEAFGGAGESDVQESDLFAQEFVPLPMAGEPPRQAGIAARANVGDDGWTDSEVGVEQPVRAQALLIESAPKARHDDDRELEPLALVDAEESDAVAGGGGSAFEGLRRGRLALEELDESEKAVALEGVELAGQSEKAMEVGAFRVGAVLGEQARLVVGFRENGFEAGGEGALGGDAPPAGVGFEKSVGFGAGRRDQRPEFGIGGRVRGWGFGTVGCERRGIRWRAGEGLEGRPERKGGVQDPEQGQFVDRHLDQRRSKNREQREVLPRVVEETDELNQVRDLEGFEKATPPGIQRDVFVGEGAGPPLGDGSGSRMQDHHVAPLDGTGGPGTRVPDRGSRIAKRAKAVGGEFRLGFLGVQISGLVIRLGRIGRG